MNSKEKTQAALKKLVRPHWDIPEEVLDKIASLPNFKISYVKRAAKSHSQRYPREMFDYRTLAHGLRESAKRQCELMLSEELYPTVFVAGGMLEHHMVADALEAQSEN